MNKKAQFGLIGALVGIPMSYFFQNQLVRAKVGGIGGYLSSLPDIMSESSVAWNLFLGVAVFAIAGWLIGHFVERNDKKSSD